MSIPTSLTSHILLYFFIFYFLTLLSFSSPTNHFHNNHLSYSTFLFLFISPISFLSHGCHPLPIPTISRITNIGTLCTACLQHHLHPITILGHFSTTSRFTTTSFSTLEFLKKKIKVISLLISTAFVYVIRFCLLGFSYWFVVL